MAVRELYPWPLMRIGILKVDSVREELQAEHGDYPDMFMHLLTRSDPTLQTVIYDAQHFELPTTPSECDGYLITGSRDSVYDELPWLPPLVAFVTELRAAEIPLVGVCFGHQLIAHFFGGRVGPAAGGWAVGVHQVDIRRQRSWMQPAAKQIALLSSHKDQVLELPTDAELYAGNDFCPNAGFYIANHTITIQGHPEFCAPYARRLLDVRREMLGESTYTNACASLATPTGEDVMARWMIAFYQEARAQRGAA